MAVYRSMAVPLTLAAALPQHSLPQLSLTVVYSCFLHCAEHELANAPSLHVLANVSPLYALTHAVPIHELTHASVINELAHIAPVC